MRNFSLQQRKGWAGCGCRKTLLFRFSWVKATMVFLQNEKMLKGSEDGCKKRKLDCRNSIWGFEWDGACINEGKKLHNSSLGVELQLKSPLPPEWEQCLDLQSGQIYYVNRSTKSKTWQDPRGGGGPNLNQLSKSLRLDLELNLPLVSKNYQQESGNLIKFSNADTSSPFVLEENSKNGDEMIAIACMQCHMFVMMCKASPVCPNCKYMHPTDQKKDIAPVRQTLSLLDFGVHRGMEPNPKHEKDG